MTKEGGFFARHTEQLARIDTKIRNNSEEESA
jgi:hypothetical protein